MALQSSLCRACWHVETIPAVAHEPASHASTAHGQCVIASVRHAAGSIEMAQRCPWAQ